ncbi:MAG: hypothetical protein NTV51_07840 [Verrucomicrobia bacterium]|nr:hypothetical protein [Verrucomicrobiota bacterium]
MSPTPRFLLSSLQPLVRLLACGLFAGGLAFALPAHAAAADSPKKRFDLPAESADSALKRFAAQSGREVLFPTGAVEGGRTAPCRAR